MARPIHDQVVFAWLELIGIGEGLNTIAGIVNIVAGVEAVWDRVEGQQQRTLFDDDIFIHASRARAGETHHTWSERSTHELKLHLRQHGETGSTVPNRMDCAPRFVGPNEE